MIRLATPADAPAICAIYNHYVRTSTITFEEVPVEDEEMARRIKDVSASLPWYVCEDDGRVAGFAYATPWRARSAYRFSVESTVYVSHRHPGLGIGARLYQTLIERLRTLGVHTVLGGISLENSASVTLHERLGFEKVGHFKDVGRKFDRWIDVGYWQLLLQKTE
ncbi:MULTISPECIES: arsinothricin resistance N-acetyltransferase ArsN1 family B [unclassified Janthinobacterium]|uniref:arsinothricin resistance N-acetyltransferase ArsN1 family B n=1 Tax=unclassified Janthinobacterium TaxID=2610881 RepID=UPI000345802F|nr:MULTISPECIES: arsinothricin resistance N-acetyltransferase ArsN1 family B [unclassified Janthinobacterium]MEC5161378.1 L-amino acid N-acyltransferase YncA [Janthinobacterium sp. CG_S6]